MDRKEHAVELKHNGHNCAQAVLVAFADKVDLSEEDLRKIGACPQLHQKSGGPKPPLL